jgi:hypothetical protein
MVQNKHKSLERTFFVFLLRLIGLLPFFGLRRFSWERVLSLTEVFEF